MSVSELARAVSLQESGRIVKVPGIGKKTAERLLLELKGKLGDALVTPTSIISGAHSDILQAPIALGYHDRDATAAVKALSPEVAVSERIRLALGKLGK